MVGVAAVDAKSFIQDGFIPNYIFTSKGQLNQAYLSKVLTESMRGKTKASVMVAKLVITSGSFLSLESSNFLGDLISRNISDMLGCTKR